MAFGDFTVTRASTKNVLGSAGLYVSVANDTPAFEFNTDGSYRGLLVEPGATNLALRSQEFDNAYWDATACTISANSTTAPDGTTTADTMTEDAGSVDPRLPRAITFVAGTNYTLSVFAKVKPGSAQRYLMLVYNSGYANIHGVNFDLVAGTVGATFNASGTITALPDGWYRVSMTPNANATGSGSLRIRISNVDTSGNINVPASYTGDGTSGFILWQAQLETGSVATSPIVTTAGTASRVADVVSLTGASSLIGASEGAMYAEMEPRVYTASASRRILSLSNGATTNRLLMLITTTGGVSLFATSGGSTQVNETYSSGLTGILKIAIRYASNAFYLHVAGALRNSDTVADVPLSMSRVDIGNEFDGTLQLNGWIRTVALFPASITEAQANSLTA
jgi:hypothetical protein